MSNFKQNTVETVGDAALAESIINRSIAELQDNITTSIAAQKFRGCSALANVIFPSVTSVGIGAFWQCTALAKADFEACVSFAQNAFYGCSALAALILRCTDAVCTLTGNLSGTPIATGTGYIYVPLALVDTYKAATGWSTYAAQIRAIEDYPEVCDPYTWEAVFKAIDAGTYKDVYAVGDLVPLDLGSEGVVNMQIAGFDVDDLADGSGKAPISWVSKELLLSAYQMTEDIADNYSWSLCKVRDVLRDTVYGLIDTNVSGRIKEVKKISQKSDEVDEETNDKLWIPSLRELGAPAYLSENTGAVYNELFETYDDLIKKKTGGMVSDWCTRTAISDGFRKVSTTGNYTTTSVSNKYNTSIAIGFCT